MKHLFYISMLLVGGLVSAQEESPREEMKVALKAQKAFDEFNYAKVIELYEDLVNGSLKSQRNLANAYWKLGDLPNAQRAYSRIMDMSDKTPKDILNYALLLRQVTEYEESISWMKKYAELAKEDPFVNEYLEDPYAHESLLDTNDQFTVENLANNTPYQEFGACYKGADAVVFASSKKSFAPVFRRYNSNNLPFLDLYEANRYDSTHNLIYARELSAKLNSNKHDGPASFNVEGSLIVFTSNNSKKNKDGYYVLNLYSATWNGKSWSKPQQLNINDTVASSCHPALSADGNTLYFASNRAGGQGGYDIYRSTREIANGDWGAPVNLGKNINTSGDEVFPFIHTEDGILSFSSNGKVGLGGLDVFVSKISEVGMADKAYNLGTPINSNGNDFGFIFDKEQKRGYLSSNREGGKGSDDIYGVSFKRALVFGRVIKGVILDESGRPAGAVDVSLYDESGKILHFLSTDMDGRFSFDVEKNKEYKVEAGNSLYQTISRSLSTGEKEAEIKLQIRMKLK